MGDLQPLVTQTLLPGAKEAYGQLPLQDFNLLEQQLITVYGCHTQLSQDMRVEYGVPRTFRPVPEHYQGLLINR